MLSATQLDVCCDSNHNRYFHSLKKVPGVKYFSCNLLVTSSCLRSKTSNHSLHFIVYYSDSFADLQCQQEYDLVKKKLQTG